MSRCDRQGAEGADDNCHLSNLVIKLNLLYNLGQSTNLPVLQTISALLSVLVEQADNAAQNRDEWTRLINHIYDFVKVIVDELENVQGQLANQFLDQILQFEEKLQEIHSFLRSQTQRTRLSRMISQNKDKEIISRFRKDLKHQLQTVTLCSHLIAMQGITSHRLEYRRRRLDVLQNMGDELQSVLQNRPHTASRVLAS